MTVKQLKEALKSFPDDLLVVSEGYEGGYDTIKKLKLLKVEETPNQQWWDGQYEASNKPDAMEVIFLDSEMKRTD